MLIIKTSFSLSGDVTYHFGFNQSVFHGICFQRKTLCDGDDLLVQVGQGLLAHRTTSDGLFDVGFGYPLLAEGIPFRLSICAARSIFININLLRLLWGDCVVPLQFEGSISAWSGALL